MNHMLHCACLLVQEQKPRLLQIQKLEAPPLKWHKVGTGWIATTYLPAMYVVWKYGDGWGAVVARKNNPGVRENLEKGGQLAFPSAAAAKKVCREDWCDRWAGYHTLTNRVAECVARAVL